MLLKWADNALAGGVYARWRRKMAGRELTFITKIAIGIAHCPDGNCQSMHTAFQLLLLIRHVTFRAG